MVGYGLLITRPSASMDYETLPCRGWRWRVMCFNVRPGCRMVGLQKNERPKKFRNGRSRPPPCRTVTPYNNREESEEKP
jgi:hypothetical protein